MSLMNDRYDVLVAGGGLSGVAAAMAAAREGLKVLLVERYGFLGGMATAGLVNPFMPYWVWKEEEHGSGWQGRSPDKSRPVNRGFFEEILMQLDELGGLLPSRETFSEEILKLVLDRLVLKYGVKVLLHSFVCDVERKDNAIQSITIACKSGNIKLKADYYIDCTGDADIAAMAGCEYRLGREEDHLCQPMTLCFRIGNVDRERYNMWQDRESVNRKYKEFREKGLIKNPREDVLVFPHMIDDIIHFNSTRIIHKSPIDTEDLTQAEMQAREQMYELYRFMKENVPGFENSQIVMSAAQTGIRESRRIIGYYDITVDDLVGAVKFSDSVARGTYPVDIHNPAGTGTVHKNIPAEDYYTIPYRALNPKNIDNLIVAGRPLSSSHEAHSAFRVIPICTCVGEGAGIAASIAAKRKVAFMDIPMDELHGLMDKYNALY